MEINFKVPQLGSSNVWRSDGWYRIGLVNGSEFLSVDCISAVTNHNIRKMILTQRGFPFLFQVRMHSDDMEDVSEARGGDIVAMFGVDCASGDTFTDGSVKYTMTSMNVPEPVMSLAIVPANRESTQNVSRWRPVLAVFSQLAAIHKVRKKLSSRR
jgi:hypothetical protein